MTNVKQTMENTLKSSKNIITIGGQKYYNFTYLEKNKKSFNKSSFIIVKGTSYYLPA